MDQFVLLVVLLLGALGRAERSELVRRVQAEMMSAARQAVLDARRDPAANPQVVSRVLNQLDVRSLR